MSWSALATVHLALSRLPLQAIGRPPSAQPRLRRIHLRASSPEALLPFYRDRLELPARLDDSGLTVRIGHSELVFSRGEGDPFYHFAFNIPENKLARAVDWMQGRIPLLVPSWQEGPVVRFEAWDAEAVYFNDPAGNVLELIAHHPLPNRRRGPFEPDDLLYVSEIGLVVDPTKETLERLAKVDLEPYKTPYETFAAVGDPHGLFILVCPDRVWLPTDDVRATVFPTEVEYLDREGRDIHLPGLPYLIHGRAG